MHPFQKRNTDIRILDLLRKKLIELIVYDHELPEQKKELDKGCMFVLGFASWLLIWRDGRAVDGAGLENQ